MYKYCAKKKRKKKSQSRQSKRREWKKKFKKKNCPITSLRRLDTCHAQIQSRHLKRREWRKRQKKKMKVGHFGNFFSKGVRLEIFFANRIRKKIISYNFDWTANMFYSILLKICFYIVLGLFVFVWRLSWCFCWLMELYLLSLCFSILFLKFFLLDNNTHVLSKK